MTASCQRTPTPATEDRGRRVPDHLDRLEYDAQAKRVRYRSDKSEGPTTGTETADPLEFLARLVAHIPDERQVMTRYYGWYANRPRGTRRKWAAEATTNAVTATEAAPIQVVQVAERETLTLKQARVRWAELLRRIHEVDPLTCPRCAGPMRIVAFITERDVIDRILQHLRRKPEPQREHARAPPTAARSRAAAAIQPGAAPGFA